MQSICTATRSACLLLSLIVTSSIARSQPTVMPAAAHVAGIRFIENRGQIATTEGRACPDVLYTAQGAGMRVFFRRTGVSYVFTRTEGRRPVSPPWMLSREERRALAADTTVHRSTYRMDMDLVGSNEQSIVTAEGAGAERMNFYLPQCPDGVLGVRGFDSIVYHDIYPKIDLIFRSSNGALKYDFVVRPGGR